MSNNDKINLLDAKRRLNEELIKYEDGLDAEYDSYMQPGQVYLRTFNLQYDESNIKPPSSGTLNTMYNGVHGLLSWLVGATAIAVGGYITINMIMKMDYNFSSIIKKVAKDFKLLGLLLMVLGIAIIGINMYIEAKNSEETKSGQMYLKRMTNTRMVVGSLNNEVMKVGQADNDISLGDMIKKIVLSILHILDFGTGTFEYLIKSAKESKITQAGIVTFMIGLHLFVYSIIGKKVTGADGSEEIPQNSEMDKQNK